MNRSPLVWLLFALTMAFYAAYIFLSSADESVWSLISGIIIAAASLVMLWRFSRELRNNSQP
ncbi:hypothetical protein FQP90_09040 [Paenarthrobacter nitroguajacolicus]|uniref:Uncharacterized protein n=1 Tax=Paenarthrobacter nitroguajacolicus TaxID=211146 RepID=A0A558H4T0_PAENT|nr:hypothetical protein [Paenarthrobacter nitroguajacolicus]TVU64120.1 hypothetical protein FQP90_09040 [Paenarthrobacter nitroguajacolicus]